MQRRSRARSAARARSPSARCRISCLAHSQRSHNLFARAIAVSYAGAVGTKPKTIKICLMNRGEDSETPWAHDLGPADRGAKGSRLVRLVNVPFLHAKPTWGDAIVVAPIEDGLPTWDRDGVPWNQLATRISQDGGRWAMIVDY